MKKTLLLPLSVLAIALAFTGCNRSDQEHSSGEQPGHKTTASAKYTCPMHSDVVKDAPGDCPKCGMKLVEKH